MMTPVKLVFSKLSPAGRSGRLTTLIFHRVLQAPDPLMPGEPDAERFDEVCGWLSRWFNVLPLEEAVHRLRSDSLPPRAAAITFDDGYADNHDIALPILQRHKLHATFFIATGFLEGGRMWNDTVVEAVRRTTQPLVELRGLLPSGCSSLPDEAPVVEQADRRALIDLLLTNIKYLPPKARIDVVDELARRVAVELPSDLMMSAAKLRALHAAGMGIGAHTVSHPILARMDDESVRGEIARSRDQLQGLLNEKVSLFAYPNGKPTVDYDATSVSIVKDLGFDAAVSTAWGVADRHSDCFQLPRFTPWDRSPLQFALRLMRNLRFRGGEV